MTIDNKIVRRMIPDTVGQTGLTKRRGPGSGGHGDSRSRGRVDLAGKAPWVVSDQTRMALEKCDLFQDIDRPHLMEVAALVEECSLQPDDKLLHEGEAARYIFVVVEGRGIAQLKLDRGWVSLGLVGPGEVAGWSSLVDGQLYPASIKALTPMKVARIETNGLMLLMNLEPEIGYPVHRRLSSIFYRQYRSALNALQSSV